MKIDNPVSRIDGIGSRIEQGLGKLGIESVGDLLHHFPMRYEDYSHITTIDDSRPGNVTIQGEITRIQTRKSRRGTTITEALIRDNTGSIQAVWFNQPYLGRSLPVHEPVYIAGRLEFAYNKYALQSPTVERVSGFPHNTGRIIPVYPETKGITSKQLRRWIKQALNVAVPDPLPAKVRSHYGLLDKSDTIQRIHFPETMDDAEQARRSLGFEELFVLLTAMKQRRQQNAAKRAKTVPFDQGTVLALLQELPFDLTDSQRKSAWRILQDMQNERPMNRLLQGDVGSGKTVVAAIAAAMAARASSQTAVLAPTEVLATQHYRTLQEILEPVGVSVGHLIGSHSIKEKSAVKRQLSNGETDVCVGTHALLEEDVRFQNPGLVVIDEQHRFGVDQRRRLLDKMGGSPHSLSMTATPIPRSLALTVYGDMDVSYLHELPPGRKPVVTRVVDNPRQLYEHLSELIDNGSGVFVVCPVIEENGDSGVSSVEATLRNLHSELPRARIRGLHGQLSSARKQQTIDEFERGELDVIVSTTVIEVGVDVANADAIVVEGAERFGLAQLHQLRGRVGRGSAQAYCYLKPTRSSQARQRLRLLERYRDGVRLAGEDLKLRGPGELHGLRQHGELDLKLADITDTELLRQVQEAITGMGEPKDYPTELRQRIQQLLRSETRD